MNNISPYFSYLVFDWIHDRITYFILSPTKHEMQYNISSFILSHVISKQSNMAKGKNYVTDGYQDCSSVS